jgi:2-iminobutanoate/2-iminopropanoate deaminase
LLAGDAEAQGAQILRNLAAALGDYKVGLEDLLIVRVYLVDLGEFAGFNRAWSAFFKDRPPARTTVGVSALPLGARVEMEFTFVT